MADLESSQPPGDQPPTWVVDRVQTRLALHGTWDNVALSDSSLAETGQWLFRIARGAHAHVFAIPAFPADEAEVDDLVDQAVAAIGGHHNGAG